MLLKDRKYFPVGIMITDILINKFPLYSPEKIKPSLEIYLDNSNKLSYSTKIGTLEIKKINKNTIDSKYNDLSSILCAVDFNYPFCGDITLKLFNHRMLSKKKLGRIAFNTAFIGPNQEELVFKLPEIDPDSLGKNKKFPLDFEIHVKFKKLCDCINTVFPFKICDNCGKYVGKELKNWENMNKIMDEIKNKF